MANYELIEPGEDVKGRRVWTASLFATDDNDGVPTLYVLTEDTFRYFRFEDESDQMQAAEDFAAGTEPEDVICTEEVAIPLADITRVERQPGKDWFYVQADGDGGRKWSLVRCPDALALTIFRELKKRLRSDLRAAEERRWVLGSVAKPLGYFVGVWLVAGFIWLGAKSTQEHPEGDGTRPVTKGDKTVDGAKRIGKWLGPNGALLLGGVASVPFLVWGAFAAVQRPVVKVLRPRAAGDRERERDDADDGEEAEEVAARRRGAGKKSGGPRPKGKGKRRGASAKVRALGIAAIALGGLAVALGWVASLQIVMLLLAVIGLGVGVFGLAAARAEYGRGQMLPAAGSAASALGLVVVVAAMMLSKDKPGEDTAGAGTPPEQAGNTGATNPGTPGTPNAPNPVTTGKENPVTPPNPAAAMADWGEPSDPDGDCKIAVKNGSLVIDVPGTPHGLVEGVGQGNAPRVMRDVEGDFAVTVKVCGTLHPTAAGTAGKALSFQAGGLLVWDNKDNYARFVRSGQNLDGTFRPVVAWTVRAGGKKGLNPQTVNVPEQDVYLHLERRGRQLAASYSLDGQNWTPLQTFQGLIGSKVSVGVVALNAAQQPMSVRFEGLRFGK